MGGAHTRAAIAKGFTSLADSQRIMARIASEGIVRLLRPLVPSGFGLYPALTEAVLFLVVPNPHMAGKAFDDPWISTCRHQLGSLGMPFSVVIADDSEMRSPVLAVVGRDLSLEVPVEGDYHGRMLFLTQLCEGSLFEPFLGAELPNGRRPWWTTLTSGLSRAAAACELFSKPPIRILAGPFASSQSFIGRRHASPFSAMARRIAPHSIWDPEQRLLCCVLRRDSSNPSETSNGSILVSDALSANAVCRLPMDRVLVSDRTGLSVLHTSADGQFETLWKSDGLLADDTVNDVGAGPGGRSEARLFPCDHLSDLFAGRFVACRSSCGFYVYLVEFASDGLPSKVETLVYTEAAGRLQSAFRLSEPLRLDGSLPGAFSLFAQLQRLSSSETAVGRSNEEAAGTLSGNAVRFASPAAAARFFRCIFPGDPRSVGAPNPLLADDFRLPAGQGSILVRRGRSSLQFDARLRPGEPSEQPADIDPGSMTIISCSVLGPLTLVTPERRSQAHFADLTARFEAEFHPEWRLDDARYELETRGTDLRGGWARAGTGPRVDDPDPGVLGDGPAGAAVLVDASVGAGTIELSFGATRRQGRVLLLGKASLPVLCPLVQEAGSDTAPATAVGDSSPLAAHALQASAGSEVKIVLETDIALSVSRLHSEGRTEGAEFCSGTTRIEPAG